MITPRDNVGRAARQVIPDDIDILGPHDDGELSTYWLQTNSPGIPIVDQEVKIDRTQLVFRDIEVCRYVVEQFSKGYTQLLEKI